MSSLLESLPSNTVHETFAQLEKRAFYFLGAVAILKFMMFSTLAAAMFAPLLFGAHKFITGKRNVGVKRTICATAAAGAGRSPQRAKCKSDGRTLLCATFPK